ncbi:MAG: class I SAM-dependent methyltransferase [Gemmatimonadetes bacterium]|nr:class I SAM-dependent methyltransferase [Gemmatimonadota bacterium]
MAEFDGVAARYEEELERGLALTGESQQFFAAQRVAITRRAVERLGLEVHSALDYGCGTGTAIPLLLAEFGAERVTGVDPSALSLARAAEAVPRQAVRLTALADFVPRADHDLAFTNGVFHHIPPAERLDAARRMVAAVRPGGAVAFWENNPWNPGTRWIMRRVSFDRDAIMLSSREAGRLLRAAGAEIVAVRFHFVFPRALGWLRGLEPLLSPLPFGGQYLVLARRPA